MQHEKENKKTTVIAVDGFSAVSLPSSGRDASLLPRTDQEQSAFFGHRILVVDDNHVSQQIAAGILNRLGAIAHVAEDGAQAHELHVANSFDLVLMDCNMPRVDGYEATRRIRAADGIRRHTPIIALTAGTGQDDRYKCLAAGMDDFLPKPIRPPMLAGILGKWLPPRSGAAILASAAPDELEMVHAMFGKDFAELVALYRADSPPRIAALHNAIACGDMQHVTRIAHAFSGSSASIGATRLAGLCKDLEAFAKAGAFARADAQLGLIESEYTRVSDKLQQLLNKSS